jgi:hypothetical protein
MEKKISRVRRTFPDLVMQGIADFDQRFGLKVKDVFKNK